MNKILLDSIISNAIKKSINEKLEIESFCNIDLNDIAKKMFDMYNYGGGNDVIEMNGHTYYLSIYISSNDLGYGTGSFFANDIHFTLPPKKNFSVNYFKTLIAHELTHAFNKDNRIHYYITNKGKAYCYKRPSHDYMKLPFSTNEPNDFNVIDCFQDILYRLWDEDERTAYLTHAYLGIEEVKKYINRLQMEIQKLEDDSTFDDKMWLSMLQSFGVIGHLKGRGKNIKRKFINKSRYLLDWYSKKLISNAYNLEN